ncbi:MAG: primosomal protein N' [Mariprofundaceae bacterium]|nr:primosomal protein N' [Mariprofundaceae bacterium]
MSETIVDIAVFCPMRQLFSYRWPLSLGVVQAGLRVRVPFGRSMRNGIVIGESVDNVPRKGLKAVADRLDMMPLYDETRLRWLARGGRYYAACPGEFAETALAWAAEDKRRWRIVDACELTAQDALLAGAFASRSVLSVGTLRRKLPVEECFFRIAKAVDAGLLVEQTSEQDTDTPFTASENKPVQLNPAQQTALDVLLAAQNFSPFLLFGCTGSGKTEVYLRAAAERVAAGGQVLILVPEIGLTPQWLAHLRGCFSRVTVWHSGLSDVERVRVRSDLPNTQVLVGTRSALFLPLPELSMIVVDEEHDGSFKQQDGVHYHARDLAVLLAQESALPIILGSATPSQESWLAASEGRYQLLELPERISAHAAPIIEQVDMRDVQAPLSESLLAALAEVKQQGQQSLLYLNRRGYAPALMCSACGEVPECPACSLRLTLHRQRRQLRCHACGFVRAVPVVCEVCGEDALLPLGEGTEKVEEQLREAFPELGFARLDRDAVRNSKRLLTVLDDFSAGRLDCLIGTQMLVKGHHFPNVTLVGVVNADLGLSLPDFRAGERWWQQLTQVVGRTGRGEYAGRVLVQTRHCQAAWLSRIGDAQAKATLDEEVSLRKALNYPPFSRWVRLVFSAARAASAQTAAADAAALCRRLPQTVQVAGPMPCAIERLAGRYRFELVLRDAQRRNLPWQLPPLLAHLRLPSGVRLKVDVDPLDMM